MQLTLTNDDDIQKETHFALQTTRAIHLKSLVGRGDTFLFKLTKRCSACRTLVVDIEHTMSISQTKMLSRECKARNLKVEVLNSPQMVVLSSIIKYYEKKVNNSVVIPLK